MEIVHVANFCRPTWSFLIPSFFILHGLREMSFKSFHRSKNYRIQEELLTMFLFSWLLEVVICCKASTKSRACFLQNMSSTLLFLQLKFWKQKKSLVSSLISTMIVFLISSCFPSSCLRILKCLYPINFMVLFVRQKSPTSPSQNLFKISRKPFYQMWLSEAVWVLTLVRQNHYYKPCIYV